ncbi:chemotaxis-specific protein-glutamate methyltransferase CheB [Alteraurantiacibacter aquimixticola]|uniref:Protein-glutamate methylesterase/protein-glutamine glutaminase n=1 Tax=Alteraurantiacibacter aquimixticola TaxID=2489173 RepID=A0A4T3EYJ6_9SPHN|nr:chemotaxis-specific protein-glutamate methyltransferase CheB [Alteraurantiacibacter aquimixticola]TIX49601.1 chemotaxis-specific protein-glutamate methyltransferase CheB [Alteraurantiacibacter aquimixticola]
MSAPFATATRLRNVRVMVVDDSATIRGVFSHLVNGAEGLELVGAFSNAEDALQLLMDERVDVILLDLEMPGMTGFEALPRMIERAREARIMIVSSLTADGAEQTVRALNLGAADTLQKPQSGGFTDEYRESLLKRIRALGRRPLRKAAAEAGQPAAPAAPAPILRAASRTRARIVAVGASTGGIHAIGQCFSCLPERLGVPILVTQHLPESFIPAFTQKLAEIANREGVIAESGMVLQPDVIYVAPGNAHLTIVKDGDKHVIKLDRSKVEVNCMPAVDPMFASIAKAYGPGALGIVLTGMGRDGTLGAADIATAGGTILVQNEATSAVWGMPGSAAREGFASAILHPHDIGYRIAAAVQGKAQ